MTQPRIKAEHTLSNGKTLKVKRYTGRDMLNAQRMAPKGDTLAMSFALLSCQILIDDQPVNYDDFLDMDGDIIQEIMLLVNGDPEAKKENFI